MHVLYMQYMCLFDSLIVFVFFIYRIPINQHKEKDKRTELDEQNKHKTPPCLVHTRAWVLAEASLTQDVANALSQVSRSPWRQAI